MIYIILLNQNINRKIENPPKIGKNISSAYIHQYLSQLNQSDLYFDSIIINMRPLTKMISLFSPLFPKFPFYFKSISNFSQSKPSYERLQFLINKNKQYLKNSQTITSNFTDAYLLDLIRQNYCFKDILTITNNFFIQKDNLIMTNIKIIFISYVYNLYTSQLYSQPLVYQIIENNLKLKIQNKQFLFDNYEEEKFYLINIRNNLNKYNYHGKNAINRLKNLFFNFVTLKYKIKENIDRYQKISIESLPKLMKILPYLPQEDSQHFSLLQLQIYYLNILKYQIDFILSHCNKIPRKHNRQIINKFILLSQFGIIISKNRNKFLDLWNKLPRTFENQQAFIFYLQNMREFFTHQLLKRISYQQLDKYNYQLSFNNRHYKSEKAIGAFQKYVENLITQKVNNSAPFDAYFNPEFKQGDYKPVLYQQQGQNRQKQVKHKGKSFKGYKNQRQQ